MKEYIELLQAAVRPLVTVSFALAFIYFTNEKIVPVDAFVTMVGLVIGFWFQSRSQKTNGSGAAQ